MAQKAEVIDLKSREAEKCVMTAGYALKEGDRCIEEAGRWLLKAQEIVGTGIEYKALLRKEGIAERTAQRAIQFATNPQKAEEHRAKDAAAAQARRQRPMSDAEAPSEIKEVVKHEDRVYEKPKVFHARDMTVNEMHREAMTNWWSWLHGVSHQMKKVGADEVKGAWFQEKIGEMKVSVDNIMNELERMTK